MEADEFNRKYHPFPALLNLMSASPKDSTVGSKSLSPCGKGEQEIAFYRLRVRA